MTGCRTAGSGRYRLGFILLVHAVLASVAGCGRGGEQAKTFRQSRLVMGSIVEITLVGRQEAEATENFGLAFAELERLDELLGNHEQRGEIWRVNSGAYPDGVEVSDEVYQLLIRARKKGEETEGAFDCTVGSLMRLWAFDEGGRVPAAGEIRNALLHVGWDKLLLRDVGRKIVFTRPGTRLDLGGIGEGYAVDRVFAILRGRGVEAGIINGGGDLRVWGKKPSGEIWKIGIQHPRRADALLGTVIVTDRAVVTSGDYEKNFTVGGRTYQHILDPATGYPAETVQSVTVVAGTAEEADAYATALVVMGLDKGIRFLGKHSGVEAVIIDKGGGVFVSPGLKDVFQRQD